LAGGSFRLVATATDGSAVESPHWAFIPDEFTTVEGDTTAPEPPMAIAARPHRVMTPGLQWGPSVGEARSRRPAAASSVPAAAPPVSLSDCELLAECVTSAPPSSGTYVVIATVSGRLLSASARVQTAPAATLVLVCPSASVVRGTSVTCVASASSVSATLAVTGWEFDPDDTALPPVPRASGQTDPTWEGAMVTSGQVRVNGFVDGVPGSASAHVSVTPRDWSTQVLGLDLYDTSPDTLPERPLNEHQLGSTTLSVTLNASTLVPALETVPDGPNVGYQYFTAIPFRATVAVAINTRALAQGSAFYLLQEPRRRVIADTLYCSRADVLDLYLPGVRAHEGIRGRDDPNSHVAIFAGRLEREARDRIESLVSRESFPGFGALREELIAIAAEDSGAMDTEEDTRNPFKSPCTMHYFN
jgi:hypothetical protein